MFRRLASAPGITGSSVAQGVAADERRGENRRRSQLNAVDLMS